jgi:hydroxymethylpyrimidine pyrophosphatase-like HAD family hydrolase
MLPLSALLSEQARALSGVVFDLDDTILDHGALTEAAFGALFRLRASGLRLIACTGRPAGWGEVIQRQWPIDAAVVENGALALISIPDAAREGTAASVSPTSKAAPARAPRVAVHGGLDLAARRAQRPALLDLAWELIARFPIAALADDNDLRVTDVTLDIGERRRVPARDVAAMRAIAASRGIRTTTSSVHLHLTREADDKASGVVRLLCEHFGEDATAARARYAFVGDSGNDAAAFAAFSLTFGVANVRAHIQSLSVPPRFVADSQMGRGFAEIAARLASLRAA